MSDTMDAATEQNDIGGEGAGREELHAQANRTELVERIMQAVPDDGKVEPFEGLTLHRSSEPTKPLHSVSEPSLCVMAQGAKVVHLGDNHYRYDPYHYLLVTSELPLAGEIVEASRAEPYLSMILPLDASLVSSVMVEAGHAAPQNGTNVRALDVSPLGASLLDAAVQLVRLLEAPDDAPVLKPMIVREIVYRLLQGEQSRRLCHIAMLNGSDHRIARAVQRFHADFDQSIEIESLAAELGMSTSSFYQHFKSVTDMTPLQFQKQLQLQEARRLMISEDLGASTAGYRVGYEDASHFSREYKRLFGQPPLRDVKQLREAVSESAA